MEALKAEGLATRLGVAPGPANGFTLDLIKSFELFGEMIDWAMIILNPLEPWPGHHVLPAAEQPGVKILTRVVDYGGIFHDDLKPGHELRRGRPPGLPAGGLDRGRQRADGADAADRGEARPVDAAFCLHVELLATDGAERGADDHPGSGPGSPAD